MSTKKNTWVIVSMRFGPVPIPILLPLRCLEEVIEGISDLLNIFSRKAFTCISAIETALMLLRTYGPLDLVDVDITSPSGRVKIKVLLR